MDEKLIKAQFQMEYARLGLQALGHISDDAQRSSMTEAFIEEFIYPALRETANA